MLNDWTRIELATRLRTMNRVLDCIVPDSPTKAVEKAIEIILGAVAQGEMSKAVTLLENVQQANPFWLRGYLMLATIYQYDQNAEQAIATMERGLVMCVSGLRMFKTQRRLETMERVKGPAVHERSRRNLERFKRYERMFRHRMVMLQVHCGRFDEAIEQWSTIEEEHCA
jgi:lipopolysaccharide biosynthesis regulator YciM